MQELYFDTAATAPLLPEVQRVMVDAFGVFGNPSSLHRKGLEAEERLKAARAQVLKALGVQRGRIVFTGGGSEANNLAIFGTARRYRERGRHLVTTQIEHPSVLEPFRALEREGWRVTYVPPEPDGSVKAERVLSAVTDDTVLVSVMHVNNETGAIQPIEEIARALQDRPKVLFHVDGIQAFGKVPGGIRDIPVDLYSMSGHKIGAPKGVGALYVRQGVEISPLVYGGGQEDGLRSGTENVIGIVAMGAAAEIAAQNASQNWEHVSRLSEALCEGLEKLPRCKVHRPSPKSPYIVSASFPGLKGEVLVHALEAQGLYVSTGSACSTRGGHSKGSHVLTAMKLPAAEVSGSIRFSLAPWHTLGDVERALDIVESQVRWLIDLER
jgi:cysteine desulfurase